MVPFPLLFSAAFVGVKFVGLEDTVKAFARIGALQSKLPRLRRPSLDQLETRLQKGFSRVPFPLQCLEQALVTWYVLNLHDHPAELEIGLSLTPLASHAWVQVGPRVFGDVPGLRNMTVVSRYQAWAAR